ncbi:hypothetical protein Tsubulata_004505, partial [Turnera subulata]
MANKFLALACIRNSGGGERPHGDLAPCPRYHLPTNYPIGVPAAAVTQGSGVVEVEGADREAKAAVFSVMGMTCSACAGSVEKAVKRLPGIQEAIVHVLDNKAQVLFYPSFVNVSSSPSVVCLLRYVSCFTIRETIEDAGFTASLIQDETSDRSTQVYIKLKWPWQLTEEAEIHYDPRLLSHDKLVEAVEDTGFEAILISTGEDMGKIGLKVDGVRTENSMRLLENSLQALPGVQGIDIVPELNKISLSYKPAVTGPRNFIKVIESTGSGRFKAAIFPEGGVRESYRQEEIKQYYRSFLWSLVFTVPVFLTSMVFMYIPGLKHGLDTKVVNMLSVGAILRWVLSTPVQFIIGRRFYIGSYKALRHGSANMDVLIALGTNAAYFYSVYSVLRAATSPDFEGTDFFETSSMLISFILLGKYLEVLAKGKTSEAIAKLMDLAPDRAILLTLDDEGNVVAEEEIDSRLIQKNDVIKIIPGAKIASDGYVIWGQSHVNESMITGEARPFAKRKGDTVIGGTVIFLSFTTWLAWFLSGKFHAYPESWIPKSMDSFQLALQFGISVMVIACPCALGLDTPTAVMVNCIVFDKTGTLTVGKP